MESIQLSVVLTGSPEQIYSAWLDAEQHAAFIGSDARIEPFVEGTFTIWEGYITGRNLLLEPGKRIIQAWRSTDFPGSAPASELQLSFKKKGNTTELFLKQSNIPDGLAEDLKQGWQEHYFEPMKEYFARLSEGPTVL